MKTRNVSPVRLAYNALGCAVIAAISLTISFTMAFSLLSMDPPPPTDPDGPKAMGLVITGMLLGTLFGIAAVIDLVRTLKKMRGAPPAVDEPTR